VEQGPSGRRQTFTDARRIRRRPEFQRVYEGGQKLRLRLMTVVVLPNGRAASRLGIAATRKLGGAVIRNRAKRLVREVFRKADVPGGLDIVVIPRRDMLDVEYPTLEAEFRYALRRVRRPDAGA
jgi:ribonuclease P protein component